MTRTNFVQELSLAIFVTLGFASCRNDAGPAVAAPSIDPKAAAAAALDQYDKDSDGVLSEAELAGCPGLRPALAIQGKLGKEEIAARLRSIAESGVGMLPYTCSILLDKRPLAGAIVKIEPESFLGDAVRAAEGISDGAGQVSLEIPDDQLPESQRGLHSVQPGIYKVKVTHPNQKINKKYNTETTLGLEIYPIGKAKSAVFSLESKP